jgi:hypothetical protein
MGLPKSEGKSVIMVVFDRLTKYAHFCALSHPFKASIVATSFMDIVKKLHRTPKIIVSDRDPIFTGNFWTKLFSCLHTQLAHSSSYYPQFDGKTEIVNKCLEGYLRRFVSNKQTQWVKSLTLAKWWYNTSFHIAAKMTPVGLNDTSMTLYNSINNIHDSIHSVSSLMTIHSIVSHDSALLASMTIHPTLYSFLEVLSTSLKNTSHLYTIFLDIQDFIVCNILLHLCN